MSKNKVFDDLKSILQTYEANLLVIHNKPDNYYLNTPITEKNKKGDFFGATQIKKNYVAFHLMPVYCFPELLDDVSEDLKKCMQGKSCFNFKTYNEKLFDELKTLVQTCFDKYKSLEK